MKKLLLITSFLASQLFAVECTEEQYSPYFTDKKENRYAFVGNSADARIVIDKNSIKYDKNTTIMQVWTIYNPINEKNTAFIKVLYEFDIKNNKSRYLKGTFHNCAGSVITNVSDHEWKYIAPNSVIETLVEYSKLYVNIK